MKQTAPVQALLALIGLALLPAGIAPAAAGGAGAELTLISFGSLHGELTTCGCHNGPKGGLARRVTVIQDLRKEKRPFLHFDLGDFTKTDEFTGDFETRFLWRQYERIGVDAITPGPRELEAWPTFRDLLAAGTIPVVSSNLRLSLDGAVRPLGKESIVLEAGGIRVGVLGLMGAAVFRDVRPPEGIEITFRDPVEAAREIVPRLRKEADLVVLLSQMTTDETDRLLTEVPGIDVALYGQRAPWEEAASAVGGTIVNRTGSEGQYLGRLDLVLGAAGGIASWTSRNVPLDPTRVEDPETLKLVTATEDRAKEIRTEGRALRQKEFEKRLSGETGALQPVPASAPGPVLSLEAADTGC